MEVIKTIELLVILLGLISNIITLVVFIRRNFKKFSARNIFCALVISDILKLISLTIFYNIVPNLISMSELGCRLVNYIQTFTTALSMFLVVYSSIDKFFFITNPKLKLNRNLVILLIILIALIYSATYAILPEYKTSLNNSSLNNSSFNNNSFNNNSLSFVCYKSVISFLLEMIFSVLIPSLMTLLFSCLLIRSILESRLKILNLNTQKDRRRLKKDIIFAISTLIINILYLLFNLPLFIILISNKLKPNYTFSLITPYLGDLQTLAFSMNLYILIIFNSIFRREFLNMFCCNRHSRQQTSTFQLTTGVNTR